MCTFIKFSVRKRFQMIIFSFKFECFITNNTKVNHNFIYKIILIVLFYEKY